MAINYDNHPCFNDKVRHTFGRVHLPVAPACNVQCNFCDRRFDCVNESRPGVSSSILEPNEALEYLDRIVYAKGNISVVGIAGPGDPFANSDKTITTIDLVRKKYPDIILCVATNGLNLDSYVDELTFYNISHITVTVNAVNPSISKKIYSWIRPGKKTIPVEAGASMLLESQLRSISRMKERGLTVKVNTIIIPGINDFHVPEVAEKMSRLKVDIFNAIPLYNNPESVFKNIPEPSKELVTEIREKSSEFIKQMHHCTRCRADAVGLLGDTDTVDSFSLMKESRIRDSKLSERPYVAVASIEGFLVSAHLGEAEELMIYKKMGEDIELVERRKTPARGDGDLRWERLAGILSDCSTIIVNGIGEKPKSILSNNGINVIVAEGMIHDAVTGIMNGADIAFMQKKVRKACGAECSGNGTGCL